MEAAHLTQAYDHARNAQHELAAGEFANAAEDTGDAEVRLHVYPTSTNASDPVTGRPYGFSTFSSTIITALQASSSHLQPAQLLSATKSLNQHPIPPARLQL